MKGGDAYACIKENKFEIIAKIVPRTANTRVLIKYICENIIKNISATNIINKIVDVVPSPKSKIKTTRNIIIDKTPKAINNLIVFKF